MHTNDKKVDHVMLIKGYDNSYGLGVVRIQNSFGRCWGQKGFVWMTYDTLEKMSQGTGVHVPESA